MRGSLLFRAALCLFYLLTIALFVLPDMLPAAETCENWMARVVSVQGTVEARRAGENRWIDIQLGDTLCSGDTVHVRKNSRAAIVLQNEAIVRLDQNTTLTLLAQEKERAVDIDLVTGIALFLSRFPFGLRVFTPFVNGNIEGTEFLIKVGAAETSLTVYEGKISAENKYGKLALVKGDSAVAGSGAPPVSKIVARPRDAVQWALYYPPIPDRDLAAIASGSGPAAAALAKSMEAYNKGDLKGAFFYLQSVPAEYDDAAFYCYRALLLLSVGRVSEASEDLKKARNINPGYGYAIALESIIALAQNRKDEALALAVKATEISPASTAPLVALSYARQARFDLDGALSSLNRGVEIDPAAALVWARIAELRLSKGELGKALDAAQKAANLNANLTRTQTVLGFAYLTQIKISKATAAFNKAIGLDQGDPLPRLGLGLALIRDGKLREGRVEIAIAAMLDPDNSLIRSYLGKAYFEEKDDKKAAAQLSRAKELDPLDPTPWFYDAIRKQTVNRPVEALEDLQKSIALNDNRAVYRSRLLLDEDLAARSVSLARIYEDLGFNWLALIEGSKSLDRDPANYSAHRFLADSFFFFPRHDIARVSELLQSQLLQPINIMPIQPQQAESNRFLLNGLGPRDPSYNEYTTLFARNQLSMLISGSAGERGTFSDSVVHSGIVEGLSYSLGQFHQQTDGFRENNDQSHNIYNAFMQYSIAPGTSVQAEVRHKDSKLGQLRLLFDPVPFNDPDVTNRETDNREMFRFGFHHAFAPGSDLIGSFMYLGAKPGLKFDFPFPVSVSTDQTGSGTEIQHLFRSERFNMVLGGGYFDIHTQELTTIFDEPFLFDSTVKHTNLYLYTHWNFPDKFVWTAGVSGDFFKGGPLDLDVQQANPKFGVTWTPLEGTTFRAAAFRTLKRTLLTDQTVEPTQVAGFNQFFDDNNATDAWRYGIGLDQKLTEKLFTGVELSKRELDIPSANYIPPFDNVLLKSEERLIRFYFYWAPHPRFAIGPEYQYEVTKFGPELPAFGIDRLETHRFGLGVSYFHPSGFFAQVRPTFVSQDGSFRVEPNDPVFTGDSQFIVLDASIGFRLPKRLGLIELVAKNLFDESFHFQDTDPNNPQITPRRLLMGRWTLSF